MPPVYSIVITMKSAARSIPGIWMAQAFRSAEYDPQFISFRDKILDISFSASGRCIVIPTVRALVLLFSRRERLGHGATLLLSRFLQMCCGQHQSIQRNTLANGLVTMFANNGIMGGGNPVPVQKTSICPG